MITTKNITNGIFYTCIGVLLNYSGLSYANNISPAQVTADITHLASDALKGRANFSPEIDQAANYISQRYHEIGLQPLKDNADFKQNFSVVRIIPTSLSISVNNQVIAAENAAFVSTSEKLMWQSTQGITLHVIAESDDMRATLQQINQLGGQHFVLVNPAHAKIFARYRRYFQQGLTKLTRNNQGTIVLALSRETDIDSIKVQAVNSISEKKLTNVVGILPGQSKSNEIVLFSSHYDHLGLSADGKEIFNGADDDASGTTAVINLAKHFATVGGNERTLMFTAFSAEEIGGFGSQYFSQQLNPDDVTAMINIEMIGKPSKFGVGTVWMTGMERSNLGALLNHNLKHKNIQVFSDPYPEQELFYRSDNATLARLGVPAHSFSSTQLDKDEHYHKATDDLASLDLNSMYQVIELLSVATQGLVDGTLTPSRVDVNEVRTNGLIY